MERKIRGIDIDKKEGLYKKEQKKNKQWTENNEKV